MSEEDPREKYIEQITELLEMQMNIHGNLVAAKRTCLRFEYTEELIDLAIKRLGDRRKIFEDLEPSPISLDKRLRWYYGPSKASSRYWPDYVSRLRGLGWTDKMIETLDLTTSLALDLTDPPGNPEILTRGLVVGRVQSGKTAHFTGLIAKAADCGYRLFIILSGITNALRLQTQKRLARDLSNPERPGAWYWLTKPQIFGDFETPPAENADLCLRSRDHRTIAVVKKQSQVLRRLIDWLNCGNEILRRECPILVIDDEADQASVNTGRSMERDELTRINDRIVELLRVGPKMAYAGYTATPFANVLIHPDFPDNLYPRSFIFPLTPPKDYFGAERIHGRKRLTPDEPDEVTDGLPLIRTVPDTELPNLKPPGYKKLSGFTFLITPSLEDALRYFFMATAARIFRERKSAVAMDFSTMLIHTSQYVDVHRKSEIAVAEAVSRLRNEAKDGKLKLWEEIWKNEMAMIDRKKVDAKLGEVEFRDLAEYLFAAIDRVKLIVSNSMRDEEANVTFEEKGQIAIIIGGNTLSRGMTLEGLVVSFFVRSANAYDTILQMGRWFGYRIYYEDLPRIWMTNEMQNHFHELATIEEEFLEQLQEYKAKGLSPLDAAMRIRRLPKIRITAPSKMRYAVTCQVSYGGARPQTIYFRHKDSTWLRNNIEVARTLVGGLGEPVIKDRGRIVWHGIAASEVLRFITRYSFHDRSRELDSDLLPKYIRRQNEVGGLNVWNVAVLGLDSYVQELGNMEICPDIKINCINRSRLILEDEQTANIKALMAPTDILADRKSFDPSKLVGKTAGDLFRMREDDPSGVLLLYPISKASAPKNPSSKTRKPLEAVDHVIGVAFVFPDAAGRFGDADYVQADLTPIESTVSGEEEEENGEPGAGIA